MADNQSWDLFLWTHCVSAIEFTKNGAIIDVLQKECCGTWTSGSRQPSAILFKTAENGSASPAERMRIEAMECKDCKRAFAI